MKIQFHKDTIDLIVSKLFIYGLISLDKILNVYRRSYVIITRSVVKKCILRLPYISDKVCILLSGSLLNGRVNPQSDVDLVVLYTSDIENNIYNFRDMLIQGVENAGFSNCDCVLVPLTFQGWKVPDDFFDKNIAITGKYFFGNKSLWRSFSATSWVDERYLWQNIMMRIIFREFLAYAVNYDLYDCKKSRGGLRDVLSMKHYLYCMHFLDVPSEIAETIRCKLKHINHYMMKLELLATLKQLSEKFNEKTLSRKLKNIVSCRANIFAESTSAIAGCYEEVELLVMSIYPKQLLDLFSKLRENKKQNIFISHEQYRGYLNGPYGEQIEPYLVSMLANISPAHLFLMGKRKVLVMAAALNSNLSSNVLEYLANLQGYEWRNIRDQVPRHPNVGVHTLAQLGRSDLRFTRERAMNTLSNLLAKNTDNYMNNSGK